MPSQSRHRASVPWCQPLSRPLTIVLSAAAAQVEPALAPISVAAAYTLPSPALSSAPTAHTRQRRVVLYRAEQYRAGQRSAV